MHDLKCVLAGVSAIPVTPFAPDGAVDLSIYERLVARVVAAGVSVVTANGNTGEFYSLTEDERRAAIEAAVAGAACLTLPSGARSGPAGSRPPAPPPAARAASRRRGA
jgi:dihydrodipicolinate synthase/N-acetylneuraminate lyase